MFYQTKNCLYCGIPFSYTSKNKHNWHLKKYCTPLCRHRFRYFYKQKLLRQEQTKNKQIIFINCLSCNIKIKKLSWNHKRCIACTKKFKMMRRIQIHKRKQIIPQDKICVGCLKLFSYSPKYKNSWKLKKYCSHYCSRNHNPKIKYNFWKKTKIGRLSVAINTANRRAKTSKIFGILKKSDLYDLFIKSPMCPACGRFVECENMTLDHIISLSKGGTNTKDNIQFLCKPCNSAKIRYSHSSKQKSTLEYRKWIKEFNKNKKYGGVEKIKYRCNVGEKNPNWKGNKTSLSAIHLYMKNRLEKPSVCVNCNKATYFLDLANISGKYMRDSYDWEWLCRRCHMIKDGRINNLIPSKGERRE